jgi:putative phosphoesterase
MNGRKLLVFSDSHGHVKALEAVFNWAKDHIPPNDTICAAACLGDGLSDLQRAADKTGFYCDWKIVSGNNDYGYQVPDAAVFNFDEHRFFMCHGHRHNLYGGYHSLLAAARNVDADIVLFGHSHIPLQEYDNGILLINPGSVGRPRSRIGATFAVIECGESEPVKSNFWGISVSGEVYQVNI